MYWTATGTHHSQTILKKRPGSLHPVYAVFQQETRELLLKTPADAAGFASSFQDHSDIPKGSGPRQPHPALHVSTPHQVHTNSMPPALWL